MASLTTTEKQILEKTFDMSGGYVLNFTDWTFKEFFRDDLNIDIYLVKYNYASGSKANRLRGFWLKENNLLVAKSISKLVEYIETQIALGNLQSSNFPSERLNLCRNVASNLLKNTKTELLFESKATFSNGNINIKLQQDIFDHVQKLLNDGYYFNAVEEAYKVVRKKLKDITGKEKATDAFSEANYTSIFGRMPQDDAEKDFFEGVKFLHMAIQFLRNEKAHTLANDLDKNMAVHYISLASLAYDLITRDIQN